MKNSICCFIDLNPSTFNGVESIESHWSHRKLSSDNCFEWFTSFVGAFTKIKINTFLHDPLSIWCRPSSNAYILLLFLTSQTHRQWHHNSTFIRPTTVALTLTRHGLVTSKLVQIYFDCFVWWFLNRNVITLCVSH